MLPKAKGRFANIYVFKIYRNIFVNYILTLLYQSVEKHIQFSALQLEQVVSIQNLLLKVELLQILGDNVYIKHTMHTQVY